MLTVSLMSALVLYLHFFLILIHETCCLRSLYDLLISAILNSRVYTFVHSLWDWGCTCTFFQSFTYSLPVLQVSHTCIFSPSWTIKSTCFRSFQGGVCCTCTFPPSCNIESICFAQSPRHVLYLYLSSILTSRVHSLCICTFLNLDPGIYLSSQSLRLYAVLVRVLYLKIVSTCFRSHPDYGCTWTFLPSWTLESTCLRSLSDWHWWMWERTRSNRIAVF